MNSGKRAPLWSTGLLLLPLLTAGGCTMDTTLLAEGRPCSADDPCGPGTRCDPVTLRCVSQVVADARTRDMSRDSRPDQPDHDAAPAVDRPGPDAPATDLSGRDLLLTFDLRLADVSSPDVSSPDVSSPDVSGPDAPGLDTQVQDTSLPDTQDPDSQPPHTISCASAMMCAFYCGSDSSCRNTCRSRTAGVNGVNYDLIQGCLLSHCPACSALDMLGCMSCMDSSCSQEATACDSSPSTTPYTCAEWFFCMKECATPDETCFQSCFEDMSSNGMVELQNLMDACPDAGDSCDPSADFFTCLMVDLDATCRPEYQTCMQSYP